ncbi:MAG: ABC transporter ATP-binding protein [Candidatus Saccharimonadales bacterium]|jgi:putative ABC transport system ATP-binding protein
MSSVIKVEKLSRTFGSGKTEFKALQDISFEINEGESVAIIGKSGSGKSTLMHQIALLDSPTSGKLFIKNKLSGELSSKDLNLLRNQQFGFVFQQFFLNGNDTVLNNVVLPLKVAGLSKKERNEMAMKALASVELEEKAHTRAADLSGGQKQRACIARALVNNPSVIFADEPTGNLDSNTGDKVAELLFKLNKERNITLIIVTHDNDLARRCERQLVIKDGELVEGK